jgi:hypothetical protein
MATTLASLDPEIRKKVEAMQKAGQSKEAAEFLMNYVLAEESPDKLPTKAKKQRRLMDTFVMVATIFVIVTFFGAVVLYLVTGKVPGLPIH